MENIRFVHQKPEITSDGTFFSITAEKDNTEVGHISFNSDSSEYVSNRFYIEQISAYVTGQGIGRSLYKEMVKFLGPNVFVYGHIIEGETHDELMKLSNLRKARKLGEYKISDRSILDKLPMVKLRRKGGIHTTNAVITCDNGYYVLTLEGVTVTI